MRASQALSNAHFGTWFDAEGDEITFTNVQVTNGHIEVNGARAAQFTLTQLTAGNVRFVHDSSDTLSSVISYQVGDVRRPMWTSPSTPGRSAGAG